MYSIVLMAALTTGTDLPDWGRRGGCFGCYGGWGGCYGGWGGCYGGRGGCYGGWGGCYGGWGGYGWGGYGRGGYGGGYGWGGWGGYVYAPFFTGTYSAPVYASNSIPGSTFSTRSMYYTPESSANNRATILVHLPEAATLTVNGKSTVSTSGTRRFYSSPLEPGKSYYYTFEARMERDGKFVKADRTVDVSAGDRREITITLPDLNSTEAAPSDHPPDERKGTSDKRPPVDLR